MIPRATDVFIAMDVLVERTENVLGDGNDDLTAGKSTGFRVELANSASATPEIAPAVQGLRMAA